MTEIESFKEQLTTEELIIIMRYGFDCNLCPASVVCDYTTEKNGEKMCFDYQKIGDFLESEVDEDEFERV